MPKGIELGSSPFGNGMLECPLLAMSGLFGVVPRMSALLPKADVADDSHQSLLVTQSGHSVDCWIRPAFPESLLFLYPLNNCLSADTPQESRVL